MTREERPATRIGEPPRDQQVVVLTGMSGGGKTAAAKLFEDLGYRVVDNLPGELLRDLADLIATEPIRYARTAIVLDVRAGDVPLAFGAMRGALEGRGIRPIIIFLEARDDVLIRRFSETRHRHPLADERGIAASIELERTLLESVRAQADVILDTSDLALRELRERIFARLGDVQSSDRMAIQLISFGFKHGVPLEADLVFDVRFMTNPHYIEALRPLSGLTPEVREYVLGQPIADTFLDHLKGLLDDTIPAYIDEGKTRLTIAIGCTGGWHRSIVMSEELAAWLRERDFGPVAVFHRELEAVNLRRWLTPGIGVKRWILAAFLGLLVLAIGVAHVIRQVTAQAEPGGPVMSAIDLLTLQFLPYQLRGLIAAALGLSLFLLGAYRLVRALVDPFALWDRDQPMVEVIYQKRFLARGPRIVAIGGGTGLSQLLRGLKEHTANLTAVVTVADDGGSSGVLRTELGIPAVGDIRNCIVALADAEPLMGRLLQYRFPGSGGVPEPVPDGFDGPPPPRGAEALSVGLGGHAVGNLLLAALVAVEDGDFEEGVREMNRVLAVRGRVVPATATPLSLHARLHDGTQVDGQSRIARSHPIDRVWVTPGDVSACDDALRAIEEAELLVIGPGSLYTSLLPALLVPGIREAIAGSGALVVYAANVATQHGETTGYDLAAHVEALDRHGAGHLPDVVLANNRLDADPPAGWRGEAVRLRWPPDSLGDADGPRLVLDDVVDPGHAHRHDPARLAAAIMRVWDRERSHRRRPAAARVGRAS